MTDHKAEWVERMLGACVPGGSYCDPQRVADAIREYCAARAAAPAASEGEDGAVALSWLDDVLGRMKGQLRSSDAAFDWKVVRDYHADLCRVRSNLTRPAAQVAATPKHDEGREALLDQISKLQAFKDYVHGRLDDAGIPKNPGGQHSDAGCRVGDRLDIALATQPAARRVTDGPLAQPLKAEWTPDCSGKQDFDADLIALSTRYWPRGGGYLVVNGGVVYDNDSRPEVRPSAKASILAQGDEIASAYFEADSEAEVKAQVEQWATQQWDRIRSALAESFAQPAEGVSGG